MGFKYMRLLPWCPVFQFRSMLELQAKLTDTVETTVWYSGYPPTGWWDALKNFIYTEYLRLRICFHSHCKSCNIH
jgi:hypothetical protein